MKPELHGVTKLLVVIAVIAVVAAALLPALVRAPAKHGRIRTPPGVPTALRQIQWATAEFGLREGKAPASLEDLVGATVLTSDGERMPFSIRALEQELGTNAAAVTYLPEFRPLDFGAVPTRENLLAYVPDPKKPGLYQVVYRGGNTERLSESQLRARLEQLRKGLRELAVWCKTNLAVIQEAKLKWAKDWHKATTDVPTWSDLVGTNHYLTAHPECCRGGVYTLGSVGEPPKCSFPGHTR